MVDFSEKFQQNLQENKPSRKIVRWLKDGLLLEHLPELARCKTVNQNPKYHQDDVFTHCVKTCDHTPPNLNLRWAGLLHDIGKYEAYSSAELCGLEWPVIVPCKFECSEQITHATFYRHEVYSVKLAKGVLLRFGVKLSDFRIILNLIAGHMYNYTNQWTDKAFKKFIRTSGLTYTQLKDWESFPLFQLRRADRLSRGLKPVTKKQLQFIDRLRDYFEANQIF